MSASQAMLEREIGHLVLELMGERDAAAVLLQAVEQRALDIVRDIQTVLDDPDRTDFECVEEIVSILEQAGIPTDRHDFG